MHLTYRDRASFAFVYIAEAHAVDEWQMQANEDDGALLHQHVTLDDRFAAAREGRARLGLTLPVLVDGMDDAVSQAFAAWPERIYVADAAGLLRYLGGPGPWEFDPQGAEEVLERLVRAQGHAWSAAPATGRRRRPRPASEDTRGRRRE